MLREICVEKLKKVPALRFPNFKGEWAETPGGKLFGNSRARGVEGLPIYSVTLTKGLVPRDSLDRRFEGDAATAVNLRAKPGDLVYNMMRMWQGAAGRADVDCMVSPAYVVLSPKNGTDTVYFNYCLQRARSLYNLWAYSYGLTSDRLRLYFQDFGRIKFHLPSHPEQKKIAVFLGTVDDKISALRRKRELLQTYKRGLMQKIFSQELRFKADDGAEFPAWEKKRLGEIFHRVTRKNNVNCRNVLTISAQQGLVNQKEYFNKAIAAEDISGYYLLKHGDFAYNKSYSKGYPMGAIKRLLHYHEGIVSTLYICFSAENTTDSRFFEQYFESGFLNRELHKIAQEGARNHGLLNLSVVEFFKDIILSKPHPAEQQKIADFLSAIDAKINAVAAQIEKMQAFKKGLLQQMFV